mgnify:FL=1|jgi:hypothetical protein
MDELKQSMIDAFTKAGKPTPLFWFSDMTVPDDVICRYLADTSPSFICEIVHTTPSTEPYNVIYCHGEGPSELRALEVAVRHGLDKLARE